LKAVACVRNERSVGDMNKRLLIGLGAVLCAMVLGGALFAQDFQRSYAISADGRIRISNISGDIKVTGYSGDSIVVLGFKEGPDRNLIDVEDNSASDRVDLRVRYPREGNCNASINFEVRVPKLVSYNFEGLSSVSGNVDISEVTGRLKAESISGSVTVRDVAGLVSASSVSGNVVVEITRLEGTGDMKFTSVSGNVEVRAPAALDADVEISTISGSLRTDFPIDIQERRYGIGRSARGRLGSGMHSVRITTVSGRVSLLQSK